MTGTAPQDQGAPLGLPWYLQPTLLSRDDVVVSRTLGWISDKATDSLVGGVYRTHNAGGNTIWRGSCSDLTVSALTREDAVSAVLDVHNTLEKARVYDRLVTTRRVAVGEKT